MTLRRAVVYIGGASLLVAWFSSAASLSLQRQRLQPVAQTPEPSAVDGLAHEVQTRAKRLKERLASAPMPQQPVRNPFVFRRAEPPPAATSRPAATIAPVPTVVQLPAEPPLVLIGIAEQRVNNVPVRIAMITTAGDELLVVRVGDSVIQRYQVTAIMANAAELLDLTTGRARRLTLQDQ